MKYFKLLTLSMLSLAMLFSCSNVQSKDNGKPSELQASDILKKIRKGEKIAYSNAIVYGDLDFSDTDEWVLTSASHVTVDIAQDIFFQNCVFMGKVSSYSILKDKKGKSLPMKKKVRFGGNVCFFNCDFRDEVDICEANIMNDMIFSRSTFNKKSSFSRVLVNGSTCQFTEINANEFFLFANNTIRGNLNFMDAHFSRNFVLSELTATDLILNNASFDGKFELSNSTLYGIVQFNYGKCAKEAQMSFSKFMDCVDIVQTEFNDMLSLEQSHFFNKAKFNRSSFADTIRTDGALFYETPEMTGISKNTYTPIVVEVKTSSNIQVNY